MKTIFIILLSILSVITTAQEFPGKDWEYINSPSGFEFSKEKLVELKNFIFENLETSSMMVIYKGKVLFEYGDTDKKYMVRSARKSFMSSLYGIYIDKGYIDPELSMKDLNIVDFELLNEDEEKATITDCLKARSGIYLPAEAESGAMLAVKPKRGTYLPGEYWCYNNWDFNVLATILQSKTGKGFFTLLKKDIADKIGMNDFKVSDGTYYQYQKSIHPAYHFEISANSLARFGYLMLNSGKWEENQIIPRNWVETITVPVSDATNWGSDGYGYMWWVSDQGKKHKHFEGCLVPEGTYSARGAMGQFLVVIPKYEMVVVHQVGSDNNDKQVSSHALGYILNKVFEAGNLSFIPEPELDRDAINQITGKYELRKDIYLNILFEDGQFYVQRTGLPKETLLVVDKETFITTRNAITLKLKPDDEGIKQLHLIQMDFDRVLKKIN